MNTLSWFGQRQEAKCTVMHRRSDHVVQEVIIVHPVNQLAFPNLGR